MYLRFNSIFFVIIIYSTIAFAQIETSPDSLIQTNSTSLINGYNKILNLHNFNSILTSNYEIDKFSIGLNNRFNSNIIFSTIKSIRDENYFDLIGKYKIHKLFQPGIAIQSKRMNDNRQIGISRFKDLSIKFLSTTNLFSSLLISPFYGYKEEQQFDIHETGKTFGLESSFEETVITSKLYGNLKLIHDNLSFRSNQFFNTELNLENFLSDFLYTSTRFYFNKIARDYFTTIDTSTAKIFNINFNIENRFDNVIEFSQNFELKGQKNFDVALNGNLFYRTVEKSIKYKNLLQPTKNLFDTKINEFRLGINGEINFYFNRFTNNIKFSYLERSEKHSVKRIFGIPDFLYYQRLDEELQKNNYSARVTLATRNKINIFDRDTLSVDASISKLRYDTPSLDNFTNPTNIIRDDRDELLYIIRLQYLKVFNTRFQGLIFLESFNNHLVYIFKERSSNNNWNRVLRLTTASKYDSKNFSSNNYFEVLANYTIYDFEDVFQTTQSFAFRQFGFQDSTKIYLSHKYFIALNYTLKLSEQGIFYWRNFSSIPGRFLEEQSGELKVGYSLSQISYLLIGARYTSLSEFNFRGKEKQVVFQIKSIGPILEGYLFYRKNFYSSLRCWIEFIEQSKQSIKRNINLSFNSQLSF